MNFKAAIFDLDGTVLDTISDLAAAMNKMLSSLGFPERELGFHKAAVGRGMKSYVKSCIPDNLKDDEALINKCTDIMKEYYAEMWNIHTKPYNGVCELLEYMVNSEMKINILSNKVHSAVLKIADYFFADFNFSCVYGERSEKPKKPDPTVALEIAEKLSFLPEEILFIGDSSFDMLTACNAKMFPMGAAWGYQSCEVLEKSGALFLANTPFDIIDFLKKNNN